MKTFKFLGMLIACFIAMAAFTACGDDDDKDEPYDPTNPMVGTWVVSDVRNWNYQGYKGQLIPSEEEEARKFSKKWMGKTIKISSKTKIEDDKVILDETSSYKEYLEIGTVSENTMTVYYVLLSYWKEGDLSSKTTATMELRRK